MSDSKFPTTTLLFVSAAVNLLLIGAAVGLAISGARLHRAAGPPGFGPGPGQFMGALPHDKADKVRAELDKNWEAAKTERDAARAARMELFRLIGRDKFDEPAVRAALAKVREADQTLAAKNQDAVIGVLKDLQPRERMAAIGAFLRGRGEGMGRGPRGFGDRLGPGIMGGPPPMNGDLPPPPGAPPPQN